MIKFFRHIRKNQIMENPTSNETLAGTKTDN